MNIKQKRLFKGTREFEIISDSIRIEIRSYLNKSKLTLRLADINPEPELIGDELVFRDESNSIPLFSLFNNKPNAEEFDAFIHALTISILEQSSTSPDIPGETFQTGRNAAPGWNVYDEPPDFDESDQQVDINFQPVNVERIEEDMAMLKTYLDDIEIEPILKSLEVLIEKPQDESAFKQVVQTFNELGINQGAVLTYAPYLKVLLSKYIGFA